MKRACWKLWRLNESLYLIFREELVLLNLSLMIASSEISCRYYFYVIITMMWINLSVEGTSGCLANLLCLWNAKNAFSSSPLTHNSQFFSFCSKVFQAFFHLIWFPTKDIKAWIWTSPMNGTMLSSLCSINKKLCIYNSHKIYYIGSHFYERQL